MTANVNEPESALKRRIFNTIISFVFSCCLFEIIICGLHTDASSIRLFRYRVCIGIHFPKNTEWSVSG
ncbi:hypothetical protein BDN72DRAFT_576390 [Pluteus cervinus]|uniref:Uncharacterized protein n=1 Tax=Pluteus cervinus TaxID=181527 RepID=A0ACD3AYA0_9AGAR|nr:hypothetical protein BDN72DRAFT_576390 [Pluteus cervinus]